MTRSTLSILLLAIFGVVNSAFQVSGNTLYVNYVFGINAGNCKVVACKTFEYAMTQATAGDVISSDGIFAPFKISKPDLVFEGNGETIIDGSLSNVTRCVQVGYYTGNVLTQANNVTVRGFHFQNCNSHALITNSQNTIGEHNTFSNNVLENYPPPQGQFGSCIKADKGATNTIFRYNIVEDCYGEGIAFTMGNGGQIYGNTVHNSWSPSIYVDNTRDVNVYNNIIVCDDPAFIGTNGRYTIGIALSNEPYNYAPYNWTTATLTNVQVTNNIVNGCGIGLYYFREGINTGAKNVLLAHNTLYNVSSGIGFESGNGQTGVQVRNNITKDVWFQSSTGTSQSNNTAPNASMFAVMPNGLDPETYRLRVDVNVPDIGITTDYFGVVRNLPVSIGAIEFVGSGVTLTPSLPVTFTSAPSLTPTRTPVVLTLTTTPSRTPTRTVSPTVTVSRTPTPLVKPTVCVPEYDVCLVDMP